MTGVKTQSTWDEIGLPKSLSLLSSGNGRRFCWDCQNVWTRFELLLLMHYLGISRRPEIILYFHCIFKCCADSNSIYEMHTLYFIDRYWSR